MTLRATSKIDEPDSRFHGHFHIKNLSSQRIMSGLSKNHFTVNNHDLPQNSCGYNHCVIAFSHLSFTLLGTKNELIAFSHLCFTLLGTKNGLIGPFLRKNSTYTLWPIVPKKLYLQLTRTIFLFTKNFTYSSHLNFSCHKKLYL